MEGAFFSFSFSPVDCLGVAEALIGEVVCLLFITCDWGFGYFVCLSG